FVKPSHRTHHSDAVEMMPYIIHIANEGVANEEIDGDLDIRGDVDNAWLLKA
ncbi:hypothetical protein Tco_0473466, partial [Tanacetum coccineum]